MYAETVSDLAVELAEKYRLLNTKLKKKLYKIKTFGNTVKIVSNS